jgi:sugar phosphate isomerase/epimerase
VTIGCKYVAIPFLMPDSRYGTEVFSMIMKNIPMISKACQKAGLTLLYHNHDFEFEKTTEDEYVLDYMYRTIPADELKVELDTCWVKVAGIDPVDYLMKYAGRCPVLHLKDYNGENPPVFRATGYGVQNMPALLAAANSAGCEWVVVEQDSHTQHTAMEDALLSRQYLKSLGW